MTPETKFKKQINAYLDSKKIYHVPYFTGRFGRAGVPDRLACVNGIFIGIEAKSEDGESSMLQRHNIRLINRSGGIGVIVYPEGFQQFKNLIEEVLKCNFHIVELSVLRSVHTSSGCDTLMNLKQ